MEKIRLKDTIYWIIRVLIAFVLIYFILFKVDLRGLFVLLKSAKIHFLTFAVITFLASIIIGGYKLFLFFPKHKHPYKFMKVFLYSFVIGNISPARVGDFSLAYFLGGNKTLNLIKQLLDKGITFYLNFLIGLIALMMIGGWNIAICAIIIGFILMPLIIFLFNKTFLLRWVKNGKNVNKVFIHFKKNYILINSLIKNKPLLVVWNSALTLLKMCLSSIATYFIFLSLGVSLSFTKLIFITGAYIVVTAFPFSIQGLGLGEITTLNIYYLWGIPYEMGFAVNLITTFFVYATSLLLILFFKPKISTLKQKVL